MTLLFIRSFFLLVLMAVSAVSAQAQISGIINDYTQVTNIDYAVEKVTVNDPSAFAVGEKCLLIQMTGATIDQSNSAAFGNVTAHNGTGNYETLTVCNIIGNDIAFDKAISRTYDPVNGIVQLVRMPVYSNVSVNGQLTAQPWNGTTGGVLALEVSGTLTLNADIDAGGLGFSPGAVNTNNGSVCDEMAYFYPSTSNLGAGKGRGMAAIIPGKENGRGKQANGGGGANSLRAGGGGGANSGTGGSGGNATDAGACTGAGVGGVGGEALFYSNATNQAFLGGGGGAGHASNTLAASGGAGGGIIFIRANAISGNNFSIRSNGNNGNDAVSGNADGAGGGGAGGTLMIECQNFSGILNLTANGGDGGSSSNATVCTGPGGGGGGGTIWSRNALPGGVVTSNTGGAAGTATGGVSGCNGTTYGATNGAPGIVLSGLISPLATAPNAGFNGAMDVCITETAVDVSNGLGGTPDNGGTWTDDDNTGALAGSIFNPSAVAPGTYDFTYTVTSGNCADSSATVSVTVFDAPDAGTDGNASACNINQTLDLFTVLGGSPDNNGSWNDDDATGALQGSNFTPGQAGSGTFSFTYIVPANAGCAGDTAVATVMVIDPPNAGTGQAVTVCQTANSINANNYLSGNPDLGGTWVDVDGSGALTGSNFNPGTAGVGVWQVAYVVGGNPPCDNDSAFVTIAVTATADAGNNATVSTCDSETSLDLLSALAGMPDAGGAWTDDDNSGGLSNGILDASVVAPGTYNFTYVVAPIGNCASDTSVLTVMVNDGPEAGIGSAVNTCTNGGMIDLFTLLGGNPDAGGTWNDDDNSGALSGSLLDLQAAGPGNWGFTYTVFGTAPCTSDQATVSVNNAQGPDAGASNSQTICGDGNVDLFPLLNGTPDAGGTWVDVNGTGALTNGIFDASQVNTGSYQFDYVVLGLAGCANDTAGVTLNVTAAPDAGNSGVLTACNAITNLDLFTGLGGTPDLNGTWFDTQSSGALSGSTFDAAAAGNGSYLFTYVVSGTAPCVNDTSTVAVFVTPAPFAGNDGVLDACETQTNVNLFTALGGNPDAGGVWLDDDATGALNNGFVDASIPGNGTYTFSYIVTAAGCTSDTALVTLNIITAPDAGLPQTSYACQASPMNLMIGLGGNPDAGGTWSDDDNTGALSGNMFNTAAVPLGTYNFTYTVPGMAPCGDANTTITVVVTSAPDAGNDGGITACETETAVNLNNGLGGTPDGFGYWVDNDNTGALSDSLVNAAIAGNGTYTFDYVVSAIGCINDSATVTLTINNAPNAGLPTVAVTCQAQTSYNLFNALAGTFGFTGTWFDDDNTGALSGSDFDASQVMQGTYDFTYVVYGVAPCVNDSSTVSVIVGPGSNAGNDSTVTACGAETALSLFDLLGGTPDTTGAWTDNDNTGALVNGVLNASQVPSGTYTFTYTVSVCGTDASILTLTLSPSPDAGNNAAVVVCSNQTSYDLISGLGGSPNAGGTWLDDDNTGALTGGFFDASQVAPGIYSFTYSVVGTPPCANASATLTAIVISGPLAGQNNAVDACSSDTAFDLMNALAGNPDMGGVWLDDDQTNALNNGLFNANTAGPGVYQFTYVVTGCTTDSATVTVTVQDASDAGMDASVNVCLTNSAYDLLTGLEGTPDINGTWNDNNGTGAVTGSTFNANLAGLGTYTFTYQVIGNGVCPNATAVLTVNVVATPDAGTGDTLDVCVSNQAVNLLNGINGASHLFGAFTDVDGTGAVSGSQFDATMAGVGTFHLNYVADAIGCPSDSTPLVVNVLPIPDAGSGNDTTTFCSTEGIINLFNLMGGTPVAGGFWADNTNAGSLNGEELDVTDLSGVYMFTYQVPGIGNCPGDDERLFVEVIANPNTGAGDTVATCSDLINLFSGITGPHLTNGSWVDLDNTGGSSGAIFNPQNVPNGTYHFLYTIDGMGVCNSASTEVVVLVNCPEGAPRIPEGFSPNSDGKNDFLFIEGIDEYPTSTLTVFNRWGNVVYEATPYQNDWDGTWNRGTDDGKPLPVGTYFYVLDLGPDFEPVKGNIYINR